MRLTAQLKLIVTMLAASVLLSGCGWFSDLFAKVDPKKMPVEQLYRQARDAMESKNYSEAIKLYETLEARFPYGIQAQQALLDMAYAQYKFSERAQSISNANRFIKLYPNHEAVDYAYYIKGLANFIEDLGPLSFLAEQDLSERDQKAARDAYATFNTLVEKYPNSKYAEDSRQRLRYLANALSRSEAHIARYYYSRGAYQATISRAQACLMSYPNTPANEEALLLLIKSYRAIGQKQLANDAERVFKATYPDVAITDTKPWWQFW